MKTDKSDTDQLRCLCTEIKKEKNISIICSLWKILMQSELEHIPKPPDSALNTSYATNKDVSVKK